MFLKALRCAPELLERDLSGKKVLITGANSGVGLSTAKQLVKQGAHVVMCCRRVEAGEKEAKKLSGPGSTEVMQLDLGDLSSVRACASKYLATHDRLDCLVNNAGIMAPPYGETKDGFEQQFGVNHLGHFLLTELLLDVVKASAPSRIVNLSSVAAQGTPNSRATVDLDDLKWEKRGYNNVQAYCQSKLANLLHARTLASKLEGTGVTAVSVHPGWVASNLVSSMGPTWIQNIILRPFFPILGIIDNDVGAEATLHCILDDDVPNNNGAYYAQTAIIAEAGCRQGGFPMKSPNPNAHDDELGEKLYEKSKELVGLN